MTTAEIDQAPVGAWRAQLTFTGGPRQGVRHRRRAACGQPRQSRRDQAGGLVKARAKVAVWAGVTRLP